MNDLLKLVPNYRLVVGRSERIRLTQDIFGSS
jgi:hypothetical protein